jgi:hypothetical protein
MHRNKWIIFLMTAVLCSGCIEPYEPDVEEKSEVLVIDGSINDSPGIQTVTVSISSPYNYPRFQPVSGCVVRVEDGSGNGVTFKENGEGIYQAYMEPGFIEVGNAYRVQVFTPDEQAYESEYDFLESCAAIEDLSYRLEVQPTSDPRLSYYGIRFYADVSGSQEDSRNYMWTFEETWEYHSTYIIQYVLDNGTFLDYTPELHDLQTCYMTTTLENYEVGTTMQLERNEIHQQPLHFVSNQSPRLRTKYSLLVKQHSLSRDAYLYWNKMKAQAGDTGGLFETQPSSSRGNIYNVSDPGEKVLGYFFVSQVREKRITESERFSFPMAEFFCPLDTAYRLEQFGSDYPYYMFSLSPFGKGPPYGYSLKECHDCTYRGGVTTRPDFWDD